jgi:uncharacterized membrane protein
MQSVSEHTAHGAGQTRANAGHDFRASTASEGPWLRDNVWLLTAVGFATSALLVGAAGRRSADRRTLRWADDAPDTAARHESGVHAPPLGTAVTIAARRTEVFGFARDLSNLPRFMSGARVTDDSLGTRSTWEITGPRDAAVAVPITLAGEHINEWLLWVADEDAPFDLRYRLEFSDAPGGRGTRVHASVHWSPPAGRVGHWLAKALRADPGTRARRDLKRLKMLMETGEIATSAIRRHDENGG